VLGISNWDLSSAFGALEHSKPRCRYLALVSLPVNWTSPVCHAAHSRSAYLPLHRLPLSCLLPHATPPPAATATARPDTSASTSWFAGRTFGRVCGTKRVCFVSQATWTFVCAVELLPFHHYCTHTYLPAYTTCANCWGWVRACRFRRYAGRSDTTTGDCQAHVCGIRFAFGDAQALLRTDGTFL